MYKKEKDISGLPISVFKQSEALISCKISLSFSDAKDFCSKTKSGLYKNKDLHEWFINKIVEKLEPVLKEKYESTTRSN